MPKTITLRLPWFPRELSPNVARRLHWAAKAKAAKAYRELCGWEARLQHPVPLHLGSTMFNSLALATTTFHVDTKRRYDLDNLMASLKPMWDGIVDAGILQDDSTEHLRHAESKLIVGKEKYIEVTLTEEEG